MRQCAKDAKTLPSAWQAEGLNVLIQRGLREDVQAQQRALWTQSWRHH